jgi:spectrin alpha
LKDALIDNRSKLGEAQTLQQFSRDADEMENWLQEKLQIASDESYKDPSNIQVLKQVIMLLSVTSPKIKLK